jgi:hypothetical protein
MAKITKVDTSSEFKDIGKRPSFGDVFDLPVLYWKMDMSNDVKNEDHLTLDFARNAKIQESTNYVGTSNRDSIQRESDNQNEGAQYRILERPFQKVNKYPVGHL